MDTEELVVALLVAAGRRTVVRMRHRSSVAFYPLLSAVWEPAAETWGWP